MADPADLAGSVLRGLARLATEAGEGLGDLLARTATIAHGTTIATNAVLTRTGAPTALLTTAGLRDALEMRRGVKEEIFDLRYQGPEPLVRRDRRYGVEERRGPDGAVLRPLRPEAALRDLAPAVERGEVRAAAVCLMHAWADPAHERELAARLREAWPDLHVACSSDVLPVIGFYDRLSTTVATAYTAPLVATYLEALARRLARTGFGGRLFLISSAGGLLTPADAVTQAARTVLSGPAAAPAAGARLGQPGGLAEAAVVDMGGTSFDVSLVRGGAAVTAPGGEVGGLRIALPMTDVRTIPLGGGSVAWLDEGGLLRLGPHSAGARPGPACFGRGGAAPTITDADLVLGYLDPADFAGTDLVVDRRLAEEALRRGVGAAVGGDPLAAAVGVFRLAAARMADAVQRAALEAGLDYRRAPLLVGGGAGPVHAAAIGRELQADLLLVPAGASTLCAIGALLLQPRYEVGRGLFARLDQLAPADLLRACDALTAELVRSTGREAADLTLTFSGDLRYTGQESSLPATFSPRDVQSAGPAVLRPAFERSHRERYGYRLEAEEVEILSVRAVASWDIGTSDLRVAGRPAGDRGPAVRDAYDGAADALRPFRVLAGDALRPGEPVAPPALVRLAGSTLVVTDPYQAELDEAGTLRLTRRPGGRPS